VLGEDKAVRASLVGNGLDQLSSPRPKWVRSFQIVVGFFEVLGNRSPASYRQGGDGGSFLFCMRQGCC